MKAIIIGAGKVGYSIAQMLSYEGHDVIVIDLEEARLKAVDDHLDVQTICGNGASSDVLREAGVREADLLVAVTEGDELNMVSCFIGKSYGVKRTIARVRNPEYVDFDKSSGLGPIGIDLIINPERVTANEIVKLTKIAEAQNVEYYAGGKVQLLELKVTEKAPVAGRQLKEFGFNAPFLIVAILRDDKMIIPRGNDSVLAEDIIFVLAETKEMREVERFFGQQRIKIESIVILGGGRVGYYLASKLEKLRYSVKVIEKDINKCKSIAQRLNNTLVINGDGTDLSLLEDENVGDTDLFVAVTGDDKLNMLVSLLAKHLGAKKTIAQIRRSDYISLVEKVGIDRAISPRLLTAGAVLRFIRKGQVVSITLVSEARAQITELIVTENYPYAGAYLKDIKFPSGAIIGALTRGDKVIVPSGEDRVMQGDRVIVFALPEATHKVEKFFGML
ncbi:MAG: Trk system potassium transporter TrkA [Desulfitobacteriaceae bacterium]|nr:Trk system potassium transporter TrkA [Desulfitobacteriaceae bacterium]MDD4752812.1 Trk system potassium transporter TrkA [Desulfitobacteriaceae bacterium]